jgi:Bacterial Ig-like domain
MTTPALERRFPDRRVSRPPGVDAVNPSDGATQVLCDSPVVLHLATRVDPSTLSAETVMIEDANGPIEGSLRVSPDRRVVIWNARRPLKAGVLHFVSIRGLRDADGRAFPAHLSSFVPCDLARDDLGG